MPNNQNIGGGSSPFIKFIGGKSQLLHELLPRLPARIETYHEPFVGGGALFFALASESPRRYRRAVISDFNAELINTYQVVRDNPQYLMKLLDDYGDRLDKESYYFFRAKQPESMNPIERAARFIYLNKTGFRGMYRVNKHGEFNIPYGNYKNPKLYDHEPIIACSHALSDVDILCADFARVESSVWPGDVIYADPPYVPASATSSFTGYTSDGFDWRAQVRLKNIAMRCSERGAHVMLSNSNVPIIHTTYLHESSVVKTANGSSIARDVRIDVIDVKHNINPYEKGDGSRSARTEVIISISPRARRVFANVSTIVASTTNDA